MTCTIYFAPSYCLINCSYIIGHCSAYRSGIYVEIVLLKVVGPLLSGIYDR